jgi:hypothetical protein
MKHLLTGLLFVFISVKAGYAQDWRDLHAEYEAYRKAMLDEYEQYRRKINEEYVASLRKAWKEYESMKGKAPFTVPKPEVQPEAPEEEGATTPEEIIVSQPPELPVKPETPEEEKANTPLPALPAVTGKTVSVPFYGLKLNIQYDFKPCRLRGHGENDVADLWEFFSQADCRSAVQALKVCRKENNFNDWAVYKLAESIAANIPELQGRSTQLVFRHFLLVQCDYNLHIGLLEGEPVLLTPILETVYNYEYIHFQGVRYYILESKNTAIGRSLKTVDLSGGTGKKSLSMQLDEPVRLGYAAYPFTVQFRDFLFEAELNKYLMDFFNDYLQTDLSVYARAAVDPGLYRQLIPAIQEHLVGKNAEESLEWLLQFVQYAFEYRVDREQFGYEKPFFAEELFYYPYSDCEDRAILFSQLVRSILNLDVLLLVYPGHAATAVAIDTGKTGYGIRFNDRQYIICDPTYIGAEAGECMNEYKGVKPVIIKI